MAQQLKGDIEVKMEVDDENYQSKMEEKDIKEEELNINKEGLNIKQEKVDDDDDDSVIDFDIAALSREDLERLAEGYVEDKNEVSVLMTREEINKYVKKKMKEHAKNEIHPANRLHNQAKQLLKELKEKQQELLNYQKAFDIMYENQVKFFRQVGVLPKLKTSSVGVDADFPILPESLPPLEILTKGEYFVDLSSAKILSPSVKPSTNSDSDLKSTDTEEIQIIPRPKIKVECVDLTFDTPNDFPDNTSTEYADDGPTKSTNVVSAKSTNVASAKSTNVVSTNSTYIVPYVVPANATYVVSSSATHGAPARATYCAPARATSGAPARATYGAPARATYGAPARPHSSDTGGGGKMVNHVSPILRRPYNTPIAKLPNVPPKPSLEVFIVEGGIVLHWDMPSNIPANTYAKLSNFEVFGYQEQGNVPTNSLLWKKIGSVVAMVMPMACTLTRFIDGYRYYFTLRATDILKRFGSFSDPVSIIYKETKF